MRPAFVAVADTTPINYLIQIGAIDLLPRFFTKIVLPEAVHHELSHPASLPSVRQWISNSP